MAFYTWEVLCRYPKTGGCVFETSDNASVFKSVVRLCQQHAILRLALSDAEIFARVLADGRDLEAVRAMAKQTLGLDKEHPGVPWQVESDGTATLLIGDHPRRAMVEAVVLQRSKNLRAMMVR